MSVIGMRTTPGKATRQLGRSSRNALDFRKIEPEMPVVVVFAEYDFTMGADDCVAELIAIATLFEN